VSVKASLHYLATVPAITAGKDVFVEWPLGRTASEAAEILSLSKKHNTKLAVVGLQARFSPVIQKIKKVVDSERLGKVLSSTFTSQAQYGGGTVVKGFEYSLKLESGAGIVPIFFGHTGDMIQQVLGEFDAATTQSLLATKRGLVNIIDPVTGTVVEKDHPRTTHDTVFLHGAVQSGAVISITMRGGPGFKGSPAVDWRILCQNGEIKITCTGLALQMGNQAAKIEVFDYGTGEVEEVVYVDEFDEHPIAKNYLADAQLNNEPTKQADQVWRNVGRIYEAIAKGETPESCSALVDFETAMRRQEFIEKMMAGRHY
jgi:predicted dehydrogenase